MLADVLREQGRRPSWVAEKLGVSPATVTLWSQGKRDIPSRRVSELAALLGVDELQVGNSVTGAYENAPQPASAQAQQAETGAPVRREGRSSQRAPEGKPALIVKSKAVA